jgi:hypothetical protein
MNFLGWPGASCLQVFVSTANGLDGFLEILPFPFKRFRQHLVERGHRVLPMSPGVLIQLGLTFRLKRHHLHALKEKVSGASVKRQMSTQRKRHVPAQRGDHCATQVKFAASSMLPLPLYCATVG